LSSSKRLFVCFYFDELPDQSRNSGVEALLLIKVIIKKISGVNSGRTLVRLMRPQIGHVGLLPLKTV
jgi:hypothetical protein